MLVFWKQRLVILATPKTGTTAIETALESLASVVIQHPPQLKHTPVRRYRRFLAPYLKSAANEDFTVVAMMREPVDWLGSWYRYRTREAIIDTARSTAAMSFDDFVQGYLERPQPEYADIGSQSIFLQGGDGPGVDRIFRYEDIGTLIAFLEDRLNCEIILPRLNVSPAGSTTLSPATEARLRADCAADFALYADLG